MVLECLWLVPFCLSKYQPCDISIAMISFTLKTRFIRLIIYHSTKVTYFVTFSKFSGNLFRHPLESGVEPVGHGGEAVTGTIEKDAQGVVVDGGAKAAAYIVPRGGCNYKTSSGRGRVFRQKKGKYFPFIHAKIL
jgi:hypothetical protein